MSRSGSPSPLQRATAARRVPTAGAGVAGGRRSNGWWTSLMTGTRAASSSARSAKTAMRFSATTTAGRTQTSLQSERCKGRYGKHARKSTSLGSKLTVRARLEWLTVRSGASGGTLIPHPPAKAMSRGSLLRACAARATARSLPGRGFDAEFLGVLSVQPLPALEVQRLQPDGAAHGRATEQAIEHVEAEVPAGRSHGDEAFVYLGR